MTLWMEHNKLGKRQIHYKNQSNTMWHGHPNEPKVNSLLRIAAKSYVLLHQRLGFPNKMPY